MIHKGFTLIELLAVIVILAIILVIAVPQILGVIVKARKESLASSVRMYASALETNYLVSQTSDTPIVAPITGQSCPPVVDFKDGTCTYDLVVTNNVPVATVTIIGSGKLDGYTGIGTKTGTVQIINSGDNDTTPPVMTLLGDNPIDIDIGGAYTESGATALDNNDGDVTDDIVITGTVDTNTAGSYTITYTVSDANGNTSTSTRTVNVLSDYDDTKGVNRPKLATGMVPIKWNGSAWTDTTVSDTTWYDYTGKQWANARTADGSMWVWVPRYSYQISTGYHLSTTGTISVKFLKNKSNIASDDSTVVTTPTYSGSTQTNYIVHPAFNFGGIDLTGFWVAKFEPSVSNQTDSCYTNPSLSNCDKTTLIPKIIPNARVWNDISVGNIFTVLRNMETNSVYGWGTSGSGIDTHMIKNIEWGALAYLSKSSYGKNVEEVWINNNSQYGTGCAGSNAGAAGISGCLYSYETTNGIKASTSGTIYGVYDMSGLSLEYVAGYLNNGDANLMANGASLVNADSKYKDVYSKAGTDTGDNNYALITNNKGDALWETSSAGSSTYSWFSDASIFAYTSYPFIFRGGNVSNGAAAGMYYFSCTTGLTNNITSRPVLLVGNGY